MAKQIYIDENGNPIEVSGTINTAELLPISGNDTTDTKTYIDNGLSEKADTSDIPAVTDLSSNITVAAAFANPDYKKLYKYGKVCHLAFRAKLNSNLADNTAFITIPASCAPKGGDYAQIIWTGTQYATSTPKNAYFGSWDNSLHNLGSITSGTYVALDCIWITT